MKRFLQFALLVALTNPVPAQAQAASASPYDSQAEHELLDQANRARSESNLSPLKMEDCLIVAARRHALAMADHQQLSHQFPGEPDLSARVAATCNVPVDEVAENVAFAATAAGAHESFMQSRPHRENLLHPSYNSVGMGVVRRGSNLFVVEDFAHSLPAVSSQHAVEQIAASVARAREAANLPALERRNGDALQAEACALAQADSLQTPRSQREQQVRYILRFTTMEPQSLPAAAVRAITDPSSGGFAAGVCFARSASYPSGAYWVVLALY